MYATCLFCNTHLGRNEAIEHFPVGRRLAYDAAKGRLWVVCRKCERWNLTPLETRWEAIEEAERLFRATKLRRTSDNIGLAEVREGLQLVRIGAPPPLEFAAWRYGDQFGRRWRRHLLVAGAGAAVSVGAVVVPVGGFFLPSVMLWGTAVQLTSSAVEFINRRRDNRPRFTVRDESGRAVALTALNARSTSLIADESANGWRLKVPHGKWKLWRPGSAIRPGIPEGFDGQLVLAGAAAQRALSVMLPYLNRGGGNRRRVREAVAVIDASKNLESLMHAAAGNDDARRTHVKLVRGESNIAVLPPRLRLALEMSLHADEEKRAMDGELAELEARWRAAEEIAAIADSLLLSPEIERKLKSL